NEITSTARVTKMNMILTGDGHNNIERKNSLKNPATSQYDIVITTMPFSLKGPFEEYKDNYYLGKANGNSLCIEHCLDAVKKDYRGKRIPYANSNAVIFYLTAPKEKEQKEDGSEEEKLKNGFQKLEVQEIKKNFFVSIPGLYKKFDFEENKHEIIPLAERFKERVAAKDTADYKFVHPQHFAYRPPGVNIDYICYNNKDKTGCITAYYPVFKVKNESKIKPEYLFCICQSEKFREQADAFFRGTARPSINFADFCKIKVPVPSLEKQESIIR
ncbi:13410_t:CDS:2, partial [Funneliformis geosporum]